MTPMKLAAYTAILVASVLLMIAQTAYAQEYSIVAGVKPGDQFTYTITGSYPSNIPVAEIPSEVLNAAESQYFTITIINVSNPNVGYTWKWHFTNGTDQTGDGVTNLEIPSESVGPFWPIVSANLTAGEKIHPHFGDQSKFNETVQWAYSNYTRATNRLQTTSSEQNNQTGVTKYRTVQSDSYFDKLTGILVSLSDQTYYQDPAFTTSLTWSLAGQTAWTFNSPGSNPPAPFWTLPVIVAVGIVIGLLVIALGWFVAGKRTQARRKQLLKKK